MAGSASHPPQRNFCDPLEVGGGCHGNDAAADDACACVGEVYIGDVLSGWGGRRWGL
jgi:hypothetical protein